MKSCVKWGGLLALLLVSMSVLGAGYTYTVVNLSGTHSAVRILNDTGAAISSVLVVFDNDVIVDKALTYGKGAPAIASIEGAGREWRVTLGGSGLGFGAYLDIAFKAGSVPVRFVGAGDLSILKLTNDGEAAVSIIALFLNEPVAPVKVLVFGGPAISLVNGGPKSWRFVLEGDGLPLGGELWIVHSGVADVRRVIPAEIVVVE